MRGLGECNASQQLLKSQQIALLVSLVIASRRAHGDFDLGLHDPARMVIVWVLAFTLRLVFMLFVAFSNSRLAQRAWPLTKVHTLDPANFLRLCAWALCALLAGMTVFARQHGFAMHIVLFLGWSTCASILLIPLCLLPRNFPTWLDPRCTTVSARGLSMK